MSAGEGDGVDHAAALRAVVAETGVSVSPAEAAAMVQSLTRFQAALAGLLHQPSFDETIERFYRLLDTGAAQRASR
jgi:hypothetical protein